MLSIIILSYKNSALLRLCLNSLKLALNEDLDYEIIVVDNKSSLETQSVVRDEFESKFAKISLIPIKENSGYTHGVNEGLRASKGDYIFYINNDIVIPSNSLHLPLEYLRNYPEVGLLGPALLDFNGAPQDSCFKFYTPLTILYRRVTFLPFSKNFLDKFLMKEADKSKVLEPDWISGAAFFTSRKAVEKVGFMDERFFHYFSDVDWARRFWENGYKVIYYPEIKIYHYLGRASKGRLGLLDIFFNEGTRWHLKDAIKYFIKWGVKKL